MGRDAAEPGSELRVELMQAVTRDGGRRRMARRILVAGAIASVVALVAVVALIGGQDGDGRDVQQVAVGAGSETDAATSSATTTDPPRTTAGESDRTTRPPSDAGHAAGGRSATTTATTAPTTSAPAPPPPPPPPSTAPPHTSPPSTTNPPPIPRVTASVGETWVYEAGCGHAEARRVTADVWFMGVPGPTVTLQWEAPDGAAGAVVLQSEPAVEDRWTGSVGPFDSAGAASWRVEAVDAADLVGRSPWRTLEVRPCPEG